MEARPEVVSPKGAWTWTLTAVTSDVEQDDGTGKMEKVDLAMQGRYVATVEISDPSGAVVDTRSYDFPHDIDAENAKTRISADVARMRDAKKRVSDLSALVGQRVEVA